MWSGKIDRYRRSTVVGNNVKQNSHYRTLLVVRPVIGCLSPAPKVCLRGRASRTTAEQRRQAEQRIRATADALCCAGDIRPDGKCDITTLARQAGVSRAALYRTYPHLKEEFEQRLAALRVGGTAPDPRDAQITRLKAASDKLRQKLTDRDAAIRDLEQFRELALSRLCRPARRDHPPPPPGNPRQRRQRPQPHPPPGHPRRWDRHHKPGDTMTTTGLAIAPRACAAGLYPLEAGVELLIANGTFLRRSDFTSRFILHGTSGGAHMAHCP
jgi:hypothetical protein